MGSDHQYYPRELFRQLQNKDVFLWAQAIAFKVLVTLVPIVILGTGIVGRILLQERPFRYIAGLIRDFFPSYQSDELVRFLAQLQASSLTLTVVGTVGLLFAAMTLFTTLRAVLANIFQEEWHEHRSVLGGYVFDIRMAAQVGLFFVLSLGVTIIAQSAGPSGAVWLTELGIDAGWVQSFIRISSRWLGLGFPFLLSLAMFAQLFYFTPRPKPPIRSVLAGAFVGAALWEAAKYAFTAYATDLGAFDGEMFSALGDTFILIIVLVFWAYYSGLVLTLGAIVTLLHETRARREPMYRDVPLRSVRMVPGTAPAIENTNVRSSDDTIVSPSDNAVDAPTDSATTNPPPHADA